MEYYLAINKNEIMLFPGKYMELEIIMLRKESQGQNLKISCFHSNTESGTIIMVIKIIGNKCKKGIVCGGREKDDGVGVYLIKVIYIYI
jgi:hypothetical protein